MGPNSSRKLSEEEKERLRRHVGALLELSLEESYTGTVDHDDVLSQMLYVEEKLRGPSRVGSHAEKTSEDPVKRGTHRNVYTMRWLRENGLSERYRRFSTVAALVGHLHTKEGMSVPAISRQLGIPETNVQQDLYDFQNGKF